MIRHSETKSPSRIFFSLTITMLAAAGSYRVYLVRTCVHTAGTVGARVSNAQRDNRKSLDFVFNSAEGQRGISKDAAPRERVRCHSRHRKTRRWRIRAEDRVRTKQCLPASSLCVWTGASCCTWGAFGGMIGAGSPAVFSQRTFFSFSFFS